MSSVTLSNVHKSFGDVVVVKDLSLKVPDGDFVSLLGPSGCGKTTVLRMVAGLERNNSGVIKLGDEVVSNPEAKIFLAPEKRHIGMVFQSYAVWPHMNVFDNVAYPLKIKKLSKTEIDLHVWEILKLVELDGLEKRMPAQLSGGQQQRVALARGLVMRPKLLLLDEPLSNLDAKLREKMREDIRKIQQQFKITCLYVTHDQVEAFTMSDLIVILNEGEILQTGRPQEIRQNPANNFVADFIR
ncbi:MAG: ABC transporter substrate-binding protein [Bdellovibrionales bacterium GWA2_49_15]|nr:MAG: ABC transporter substrate-binding protein [Bdellovibrionales bacterium GWA2_49_15]HAZ12338.1 ABC transporter substrate-binding protein [Bdellovibrionales bacterium]